MLSHISSSQLCIERISKTFGPVQALDDISFRVEPGEFLTILGPSGSGKTTLLRVVAGFENPTTGTITVDSRNLTLVDPSKRNIGMVFQNYALFPHMSVSENIAFPLRMRREKSSEIKRRVEEVLELVELSQFGDRTPKQLSGGQQQRVALARAIVFRPKLLLLDEPFGALDRKLREQMQLEVRRLQRRLNLTTVFITHDQEEALIMSDRIAVMNDGKIQQIGYPNEIYEAPGNKFVADFIGESNILTGTVVAGPSGKSLDLAGATIPLADSERNDLRVGKQAQFLIRPERFFDASPDISATTRIEGVVVEAIYVGTSHKYKVDLRGGQSLLVRLSVSKGGRRYGVGDQIFLSILPEDLWLIKSE